MHHNTQKYSTFDSDNDSHSRTNCASQLFGGLWFKTCHDSHLNGSYYSGGKMAMDGHGKNIIAETGIHWLSTGFNGDHYSLIFTEMKVRKKL